MKIRLVLFLVVALSFGSRFADAQEPAWHVQRTLTFKGIRPSTLLFAPDGARLVVGSRVRWYQRVDARFRVGNAQASVVDIASGRVLKHLPTRRGDLVAAAFLPSGRFAMALDQPDGGQVAVEFETAGWSASAQHVLLQPGARAMGDDEADVSDTAGEYGAFSADGSRFAAHYGHIEGLAIPPRRFVGRTVVWDTSTWRPSASFSRKPGADTPSVFFAADATLLADSALELADREDEPRNSTIERISRLVLPVYGLEPAELLGQIDLAGAHRSAALSPDGRWLVASVINNSAGSLLAYDIGGGRNLVPRVRALDPSPKLSRERLCTALAFSADGRWLVAGLIDGTLRIYDAETWESVFEAPAAGQEITALAFSPDNRCIAVGSRDGRLRLWVRD